MKAGGFATLPAEIAARRGAGLFRARRVLDSAVGPQVRLDGKPILAFCSNDYLGLANDPRVIRALQDGAARYGAGSGASHLVCGHSRAHHELEEALAVFTGRERALLFSSGYAANIGVAGALLGKRDAIFQDRLNHASLIDGGLLCGARFQRFAHADIADLGRRLARSTADRTLVAVDGVFSMDGDIAPLDKLTELAGRYGLITMVDDAHGEGVLGRGGRGIVDHFGLHGRVDVEIGTMSKAFGVMGGMAAGSALLIDYIRQKARTNLFSSALTIPDVAANLASVEILQQSEDLVRKLWANGDLLKRELKAAGFDTAHSETPITPVTTGEAGAAKEFSSKLFEAGVFATAIVFPTVPRGTARIRAMVSAAHSEDDLAFAVEKFTLVGRAMGVVS